jgi:hypothetical protein
VRELRHTAGIIAGLPDGREPLDVAVSTAPEQDLVDIEV